MCNQRKRQMHRMQRTKSSSKGKELRNPFRQRRP
jgi:hypothetical protein